MSTQISKLEKQNVEALHQASDVLKILSNPSRLSVMCYLGQGELSVNELADAVGLSQSALSQHLTRLKRAGLVKFRRDHNKIYYSLDSREAKTIIALLKELYCKNLE